MVLIASQRLANRRQFRDSADLELKEAEKVVQSMKQSGNNQDEITG
jgi:hypothetical protein